MKRTCGGHRPIPTKTDAHRVADGRPATKEPGDRRDQGVEAHARLDGQRAQTQGLEDMRNLPRTVDPDELQSG